MTSPHPEYPKILCPQGHDSWQIDTLGRKKCLTCYVSIMRNVWKNKTPAYPFTKDQLQKDYQSGMSQCEIASKYHSSQPVVCYAMRRFEIKARVAAKRDQWGEKNKGWKDNAAGYQALHLRLIRRKGKPRKCEFCGTDALGKHYDWANMTGRYEDIDDYRRLCRSCHNRYDKLRANFRRIVRSLEDSNDHR
jgi:hypothetical protein